MVCQNIVNAGLAHIKDYLKKLLKHDLLNHSALCFPLLQSFCAKLLVVYNAVQHGCLYISLWILCAICTRYVHSYTFLCRLHTVGNECSLAQCFFFFSTVKMNYKGIIHTWCEKRKSSNGCQAKTKPMSLADSWLGRGIWEGEPSYMPMSLDPVYKCSLWLRTSFGALFYGEHLYKYTCFPIMNCK